MLYRIGRTEVDTDTREMLHDGKSVVAEPLAFDLLQLLVENRERVVGKEELLERIWHGRVVSDAAVSRCVRVARRALGDDGREQRMIRTYHRRGFRFVGPIEVMDGRPHRPATGPWPGVRERTSRRAAPSFAERPLSERASITVPPLRATSHDATIRRFADALSRDIDARLARTRWLFVVPCPAVAPPHDAPRDGVDIGRGLGVRYVLDGTLANDRERLRLTATLLDTVRCRELWAERIDRSATTLFELQDELGRRIAAAAEAEIEIREMRRAFLLSPSSLDAWSAYLQACRYLFRAGEAHRERAAELLALAVRLDPGASRVFAALSFLHWQRAYLGIGRDRAGDIARAFEHAYRSVSLDPHDPQGHWVLGRAHYLEADFERGVTELQRAAELDPDFARGQCSPAGGMVAADECAGGAYAAERGRRPGSHDPLAFAFSALHAEMLCLTGEVRDRAGRTAGTARRADSRHRPAAAVTRRDDARGRHERARHDAASLRAAQPAYTRDEYFLSFPFQGHDRGLIEPTLARLGL